jgi:1,4-alpha-glucan branching enzyme
LWLWLDFYDPKFVGDSIRYMVEEFHIDGLRFDAARQIQNFDFLHWVVKEAKKAAGQKPFYCVAEFLPDEPCITNIDGPMDGCNKVLILFNKKLKIVFRLA